MHETIIYIIRHGDILNPNNVLYGDVIELELSDEGREQIKKLALIIKASGIIPCKIYTSYLERTADSSNILAQILEINDIEFEIGLADSHIPAVAGKPKTVRYEIHKTGHDEYEGKYVEKGNESRKQVVDRMFSVFKKAFSQNLGKCAAIVSHGDPIRFLLFKLENPNSEKIESMAKLVTFDYLPKGCAWKLTLNSRGELNSKVLIESLEV